MNQTVHFHSKKTKALAPQKKINSSNLPFTLNTTIGCLFSCSYCYLQNFPFSGHSKFGEEIFVKTWIPEKLDDDLKKYKDIPQHLKRVQVNPATEGFLPQAISIQKKQLGRDIMEEILEVFRKHWNNGNKWMVHLVTKSHMLRKYHGQIVSMKDQIQIELTITTLDEDKARMLEVYAPTVKKRLELIELLAKDDVFVRAMCMPFIGSEREAKNAKQVLMNAGAKGFKHKGMNYWDAKELLKGNRVPMHGKRDVIYTDLLVKSEEPVLDAIGNTQSITMLMPDKLWKSFAPTNRDIIDSGYSEVNSINWGYIK